MVSTLGNENTTMGDDSEHHAPKACKHYAVDVNQQAASIADWQQRYNQHSQGAFWGHLAELTLAGTHIFEEYTNQALHQRCCVGKGKLWLGFSHTKQAVRINGMMVNPGGVLCRPADVEFELATPQDFTIFGIVLDQNHLLKMLDPQQQAEVLSHFDKCSFELNEPRYAHNLAYLIQHLLLKRSGQTINAGLSRIVSSAILDLLTSQPKHLTASTCAYQQRMRAVQRVTSYIHDSGELPLTVDELCQIACVSRRTLHNSFETILGISPMKFIRYTRLNHIRRELLQAKPNLLISELAHDYGFFHLGKFDFHYRSLFGETPSATQARSQIYAQDHSIKA